MCHRNWTTTWSNCTEAKHAAATARTKESAQEHYHKLIHVLVKCDRYLPFSLQHAYTKIEFLCRVTCRTRL